VNYDRSRSEEGKRLSGQLGFSSVMWKRWVSLLIGIG
jgi:hypothetical protein